MTNTISPEIKAAYAKYVAKQKQGRQRGWESEATFARDCEKYFKKDWGPTGDRVKKESVGLSAGDRRRMLEIAGMSGAIVTEAKKTTVKEDAAQSLEQTYGALGRFVVDILETYKGMAVDPEVAGELDTRDMAPKIMEGYIDDMVNDLLGEIYESAEFKQLCTEMMGQHTQLSTQPEQGVLDV